MKPTAALSPGCKKRLAAASRYLVLVHLANLHDLVAAYGRAFHEGAAAFITARLETLSNPKPAVFLTGQYAFVELEECRDADFIRQDTLCEHINALLTFEPVMLGKAQAFLRVETTLIDRNDQNLRLIDACEVAASKSDECVQRAKYRADMALALNLFSRLADKTLILAFQPVVSIKNGHSAFYWKTLPAQRLNPSSSELVSCAPHIAAIERLGLGARLDRSVLWTVLALLIEHPEINLGCRVSARSLKFDCGWRLIFNAMQSWPCVASRLTIEITETFSITQDDEAITLLRTLGLLGCKVAVDAMQSAYGTLDFVVRARPDFVKIDKSDLHSSSSARSPSSHSILRNLSQLCPDSSPRIITEGIESGQDRADAAAMGSDGLQGALFGLPGMLPYWLTDAIPVRDAFEPQHPSHSRQ